MIKYKTGDQVKLVRLDRHTDQAVSDYWDGYVGQVATVETGRTDVVETGRTDVVEEYYCDYVEIRFANGALFPARPNEIEPVQSTKTGVYNLIADEAVDVVADIELTLTTFADRSMTLDNSQLYDSRRFVKLSPSQARTLLLILSQERD